MLTARGACGKCLHIVMKAKKSAGGIDILRIERRRTGNGHTGYTLAEWCGANQF